MLGGALGAGRSRRAIAGTQPLGGRFILLPPVAVTARQVPVLRRRSCPARCGTPTARLPPGAGVRQLDRAGYAVSGRGLACLVKLRVGKVEHAVADRAHKEASPNCYRRTPPTVLRPPSGT